MFSSIRYRHQYRHFLSSKKGFTLIELLIIVIILGVLMAALIPQVNSLQSRVRDTMRTTNMIQISSALEIYSLDHGGMYPVAPFWGYLNKRVADTNMNPHLPGLGSSINNISKISPLILPYMNNIPEDEGYGLTTNNAGSCTIEGNFFSYYSDRNGKMYAITSLRESKRGNTTNCRGDVNSENGNFYVLGKGLKYTIEEIITIPPYNGTDDPIERCKNQLTTEEVSSLGILINQSSISKQNLCQLTWFNAQNNSNIILIPSAINKLVNLQGIVIERTSISYVPSLSNLTRLSQLHIRNNTNLSTPITISNLPNLSYIYIENNAVPSISINNLHNINSLYLQHNTLTNFPDIQNSSSLKSLYLNYNNISILPNLSSYNYLQTLQLYNNPITSLSPENCSTISLRGYGVNIWVNGVNICS